MKSLTTIMLLLFSCALIAPDALAQKRKKARTTTTTTQQTSSPNVSGQPNYITAPEMDKATPQAQPTEIKMNIKRQKKVRIVPAPPPGPPQTPIPPKE